MKQTKLRTLILAAMFAALTCVATMIIHIPSPIGGYFNLGDCMVLLSAFVLGPVWGTAAGGIGSALADVICGYFVYAPGTLVIKALMALAAALSALVGAVIMVVGYFLYELPLFGYAPSLESAVTTNLPQAAVGLVAGMALFTLLDRTHLAARMKGEPIHA